MQAKLSEWILSGLFSIRLPLGALNLVPFGIEDHLELS